MARPGLIYPARAEIETEIARNSNYLDGIAALMRKYELAGWEEPFAIMRRQLNDYDAWVRSVVLPRARSDFASLRKRTRCSSRVSASTSRRRSSRCGRIRRSSTFRPK